MTRLLSDLSLVTFDFKIEKIILRIRRVRRRLVSEGGKVVFINLSVLSEGESEALFEEEISFSFINYVNLRAGIMA
ncbi:hypothetical protein DF186_22145, partial [Enterococcus hirae]